MKRGSVVLDMAVESGGNVEGSKVDEIVEVNGERLLGYLTLHQKLLDMHPMPYQIILITGF